MWKLIEHDYVLCSLFLFESNLFVVSGWVAWQWLRFSFGVAVIIFLDETQAFGKKTAPLMLCKS